MGLPLAVVVTPAHIQDRDGDHRLLGALRARFSAVCLPRPAGNGVRIVRQQRAVQGSRGHFVV